MSWLDKAKGALNKGVEEAKAGLERSIQDAKENAEIAAQDRKEKKQEEKERRDMFRATSKTRYLEIDKSNQLWRLTSKKNEVFRFDELVSYELIQDGESVTSGGFGIGRAIAGAALTGGLGALVGFTKKRKSNSFTNNLQIRVTNSASSKPTTFIAFIEKKTDHNSKDYRKAIEAAQETLSLFDIITHDMEK